MSDIVDQIKKGHSQIFRRAFIKRRQQGTGLFEDDWFEITGDIKKWGKIKSTIDAIRLNKFNFSTMVITLDNTDGRYNPEDSEVSLWYGYLQQQRTLVRIETGFINQTLGDDGIWQNDYYLENALFDESEWDSGATFDGELPAFYGIINGDIQLSEQNEVTFNLSPLTQVFRDFSARNLTGFDSSITASRFVTLLRDQTDGAGSFVFRPFFDNTTTNWDIATTTVIYSNLNTSAAKDIRDMDCWEVIEKLAEAESHVAYISGTGKFVFRPKDDVTTTAAFNFYGGSGLNNVSSPITIKKIASYGRKQSKFYSRIEVKYIDDDTTTSLEIRESTLTVASNNAAWNLGQKTFRIENFWIPTSTVAQTIAQTIFDDYSAVKNEIEFTSTFVPHLEILDRITVTYDASPVNLASLWDQRDWAHDSNDTATDLIWDSNQGNGIKLQGDEFKLLALEIDIDKFECKFTAREV